MAVTLALCDVGMDAECMSAALLRDALVAGSVTLEEIEAGLGSNVMRLTHDCVRLRRLPGRVTGSYDDATAEKLRTFCLSFHDVRAVVVELAYRADALRDFENAALSAVQRTALALETMQLYAPMAHALDAGPLCAELEDLALRALFPSSYRSLEKWLRGAGPAGRRRAAERAAPVAEALARDPGLMTLVGGPAGVAVKARRKSLFSTMKKVLRDGRAREDVHDLLGMRVIVTPQPGSPEVRRHPRRAARRRGGGGGGALRAGGVLPRARDHARAVRDGGRAHEGLPAPAEGERVQVAAQHSAPPRGVEGGAGGGWRRRRRFFGGVGRRRRFFGGVGSAF